MTMLRGLLLMMLLGSMAVLAGILCHRRWSGQRPPGHWCLGAASLAGTAWMGVVLLLAWIEWGWKAGLEPDLRAPEWFGLIVLVLLDTLLAAAVAMVPIGVVALLRGRI